jgi:predicted RNA-binding Zn ribbon-like protein
VLTKRQTEYQFDLTGGSLCLDFANTVSRRDDPDQCKEHLTTYSDLISFAAQTGLILPGQVSGLQVYARRHVKLARDVFHRGIALRETLYRAFAAIAQHQLPQPADLQRINDAALEALGHRRLIRSNGGYRWQWNSDGANPLDRIFWPVANSAAELLTSKQLRAVRLCEAPDCEWLFLDHSRNRSRRWCDMTSCGNRQKARRHYQRTHE